MTKRYELLFSSEYIADYRGLHAYDRPPILSAVVGLVDQAEVSTRNRRRLKKQVSWCPEATWQLRAQEHRVLYRVAGSAVHVLRLIFKSQVTTEEMGS